MSLTGSLKRWALRRLKQVGCLIGGLLLVLMVWSLSSSAVANWKLHKLMNQEREKGYPVTVEELVETLPMPAEGQNAADVYRRAFQLEVEVGDEYRDLVPIVGELDFEVSEPLSVEAMQTTRWYLDINSQYLSILHEAAGMPECRFVDSGTLTAPLSLLPIDYVISMRQAILHLLLEALYAGEMGDGDKAADSIVAALHAAKAAGNDPGQIGRFSSSSLVNVVVNYTVMFLSRHALPDDGLMRIADVLSQMDSLNRAERLFIEERVLEMAVFKQMRWDDTLWLFGGVALGDDGEERRVTGLLAVPIALSTAQYLYGGQKAWDRLAHFELTTGLLEAAQFPLEARVEAAESLKKKAENLPKSRALTRSEFYSAAWLMESFVRDVALRRAATTGIAVERFRLANGRLPESLNELVPEWLETVPQDPFDAKPLRYKVDGPSYCVYSIGQDLADNGGQEYGKEGRDVPFRVERSAFPLSPVVLPPPQPETPLPDGHLPGAPQVTHTP